MDESKNVQSKEDEIISKLSSMESSLTEGRNTAKLLADPDVRQLLEAKQRGEKVKLSFGEDEPLFSSASNMEDMTNAQLADHVSKTLSRRVDLIVEKKLSPLIEQLKGLSEYVDSKEASSVDKQLKEARSKYSDFDSHLTSMKSLNKANPGLSIEELYLISKSRQAKDVPETPLQIESEKPSSTSARTKESAEKKPVKPGHGGFSELVSNALENLDLDIS